MQKFKNTINNIDDLNQGIMEKAQNRLDNLTKPPGSLGKLENIAVKLAGITGEICPKIENKTHIIMVGDHGVVKEGVSAFPQEVTTSMVDNFLKGGAAINVLTSQVEAELKLVDIGMKDKIEDTDILDYKVKSGTDNFVKGPAMSREEAIEAIEAGIEITEKFIKQGADLIGTGEMGIGNTSPSSAILAVLTDYDLDKLVGPGTGLKEKEIEKKKEIIARAIKINAPDPEDPIDVLAKVGGLEIAGMAGCILGAARKNRPVLIDGLISGAAALIAANIESGSKKYMLPSHISSEPGHIKTYDDLNLDPFLDLNMRLGEGTGAVLAMELVEAASNIIREMATFAEAGIK